MTDDGTPTTPAAGNGSQTGNGLRGMLERAGALGGTLTAEPLDRGGFHVVALLPTGDQTGHFGA